MAETLTHCDGCDLCGLRCSSGVPCTRDEWVNVQAFISAADEQTQAKISRTARQDKSVSLGDDVFVQMCRYRDMENGGCVVYPARPLICRLLGHVPWMPCPVDKVPHTIPADKSVELMLSYSEFERKTFEEWEEKT